MTDRYCIWHWWCCFSGNKVRDECFNMAACGCKTVEHLAHTETLPVDRAGSSDVH